MADSPPLAISREERASALGYRGATVWVTGLPAAGKTTLSAGLERALLARGRPAYRLDGDEIRRDLCGDLGFDRESRAENVRRVAHIASMLAESGLIAIAALISPYAADRALAREAHTKRGVPFLEVYLDTPLALCERRDPKGLYARARRGEVSGLTGVGGAYEAPEDPDVRIHPEPLEDSIRTLCEALTLAGVL